MNHQITIITIKDAIRIFELNVGNEIYGYYGQTEKWNDMGFDLPPIADKTRAFNVRAGKHLYARVFKEGSKSKAKSPFILRYDDIKGLNAIQISEKYALPQIPDKIVQW